MSDSTGKVKKTDTDSKDGSPGPAVDQTAKPVTQPTAPDVMNAGDLRNRIVFDMPQLKPIQQVLNGVAALLSQEHLGIPIEVALKELKTAKATVPVIKAGISAMRRASDDEASAAAREFNEKAGPGRQVDPVTLNPVIPEADEKTEQATYKNEAVVLKARVVPLKTALFRVKNDEGIVGWVRAGLQKLDEATLKPMPQAELPGWQTPPKLDVANPSVRNLLDQLDLIEATHQRLGNVEKTLAQLANLNPIFTSQYVETILDTCVALADEQIVQSTTIEGVAEADAKAFVAKAQKIASVRTTAEKAEKYLNSGK